MANPQTNLRVRISSDLADIKAGLATLRKDLSTVKKTAAESLGNQNAFVGGLQRARRELAGIAATYLSMRGASVLAGLADEATQLRGRLRAAKADYDAIFDIAERTRSGLSATVDLYARMERSTRSMDISQERLLGLTESVNQAIRLSYTTAAAGEAAVMQFGQALAAGELRGEELNSVLEQTPRLAEAVAAGMGKQVGELRALAKEGKLAAGDVLRAVETQSAALAEEFAEMPLTIGDAWTQVRNSLVDYVGDQDAATGASRRFAATLQQIAQDLPKYLDPLLQAVTALLRNLDALTVFMVTRMALAAIPAVIAGVNSLRAAIIAARTATLTLNVALAALGGPVGLAIAALAGGLYWLATRTDQARKAAQLHSEAMDKNRQLAEQNKQAALDNAEAMRKEALAHVASAQAALQNARAQLEVERSRPVGDRGAGGNVASAMTGMQAQRRAEQAEAMLAQRQRELDAWTKQLVDLAVEIQLGPGIAARAAAEAAKGAADSAGEAVRGVADEAELAQDQIKRALEELDRLFEAGSVGIADYHARRAALQTAAIDGQLAQAQAEAASATSSDAQSKALTRIIKLQRDRAEIALAGARDQKAAEEELAKQLGEVHLRLLELDGETARAARARLESEFLDLFKRLEAEGDEAGAAIVRNLINREVAREQIDQFQQELQRISGGLDASETSLSSQAAGGLMGGVEAERQLRSEREAALVQLRALREEMVAYLATIEPGSPEHALALQGLQEINATIGQVGAAQQQLRQQVQEAGVAGLTNFFMDIVNGAKSAKEALRDFVLGFVQSMAQIASRALATFLVLKMLDAVYPGLGKATAATMGAGVLHSGGIAGMGGRIRQVSPLLFGAAPRYHNGGIAGLAPNEVPAILERGEEVLTRSILATATTLRRRARSPRRWSPSVTTPWRMRWPEPPESGSSSRTCGTTGVG